jgi:hypothetical protein
MNRIVEVTHDRKAFLSLNRRLWWHRKNLVYQYGLSPLWIGTIIAVVFFGNGSVFGWVACITSAGVLFQPVASYVLTMRLVKKRSTDKGSAKTLYILNDDSLTIEDEVGRAEIFWQGINSILKFDQGWILGFPKGLEIIFPVQALDEETKRFLESKLQDAIIAHKAKPKVISPINN